MSSLKQRGLLSRLGVNASIRRSRGSPSVVDRFGRLSIGDDDTASVNTVLPAYPFNSEGPTRPATPAPTYNTIDQPESKYSKKDTSIAKPKINAREAVDELVGRIFVGLNYPKAWRLNNDGTKSYFWALGCLPGTADVLQDNIHEIREKVFGKRDWQIEKFCLLFKGQTFGDLWCRPLDPVVSPHSAVTDGEEIWYA
jgi:hypothetical protein